MRVVFPDLDSSAGLTLRLADRLTDDQYFAFCMANRDLNLERMPRGEIVINPSPGAESDHRALQAGAELWQWARSDGRGRTFGSSAEFFLPNGAALSPYAAWVSNERIASVSKRERREFPHVVPEFVIEVLSPNDRLAAKKRKMRLWAKNGVDLGWLIDGDNRRVYVYRGTAEARLVGDADSIAGEGPVDGFVLPLTEIWAGL